LDARATDAALDATVHGDVGGGEDVGQPGAHDAAEDPDGSSPASDASRGGADAAPDVPTPDDDAGATDVGKTDADGSSDDAGGIDATPAEDAGPANEPPTANAGPDQQVDERQRVTLDGTGSDDVDQDELAYTWQLLDTPEESAAALTEARSATPSFVADRPGTYRVELVVFDGHVESEPDVVEVLARDVPDPPSARIGPLVARPVGEPIVLDGSGSRDPDGDALAFSWSLVTAPDGSGAEIEAPAAEQTRLVPDHAGRYGFSLVVSDGDLESPAASAEVVTANSPPIADAGEDFEVPVGATATLDGTGSSDPDVEAITFAWAPVALPEGSTAELDRSASADPSFVADLPGAYVFALTVVDGAGLDGRDEVTVHTENRPPVADAGEDLEIEQGAAAWLDGRGSGDPDGDGLAYEWTLAGRPEESEAALSATDLPRVWFLGDVPGPYAVTLVVRDRSLSSAPDSVGVRVNAPPVAEVGDELTGQPVAHPAELDGSASHDPDGFPEPLTWSWEVVSTPPGSERRTEDIFERDRALALFFPDVPGLYRFDLTVDDGLSTATARLELRAVETPDLAVRIVRSPAAGHPQARFEVIGSVDNLGPADAPAAEVALLVVDGEGAEHLLAVDTLAGIAAGAGREARLVADLAPEGLESGADLALVVRVDHQGLIAEGDEENNVASAPFEVALGSLMVSLIQAPVLGRAGEDVAVTAEVSYRAQSVADPPNEVLLPDELELEHTFWLRRQDGEAWELGRVESRIPAAGGALPLAIAGRLADLLAAGTGYSLGVEVDSGEVLLEDDEEDNEAGLPFEVVAVDLQGHVLAAPVVQTPGGAIDLECRIWLEAQSEAQPPNALDSLVTAPLRHELLLIDTDGVTHVVGSFEAVPPAPGETADLTLRGAVPPGAAPGAGWRLVLALDATQEIVESVEGDNRLDRPFEVAGSNLRGVLNAWPVAGVEGERVEVRYDVFLDVVSLADPPNDVSTVAYGGFRRELALVDGQDGVVTLLHSEFRSGSPPGEAASRTIRTTLPRPLAPGANYRLRLAIDTADARHETNEDDNELTTPFELLRGDLRVWIDDAPGAARAGDVLRVRYGLRYDAPSAAEPPTDLSDVAPPAFARRVHLRDRRDGSERLLAGQLAGGLAPNEDDFAVIRPQVPAEAEPGAHYDLVLRLNEEHAVAEPPGAAENNEAASPFVVEE